MTDHGNTVLREALALPAEERAQVAADLIASLDADHDPDDAVASAWANEIERRARLVLDGQQGEDWDTARERIAGRLRDR